MEERKDLRKKQICIGLLAHVDAGKTTLSEAMLYEGGQLRTLGRVDHQDAFLDTDAQERARGITIFSKQAVLQLEGAQVFLLDTPGHVDFSSEMERTLQVLDYAILVINGSDGVQSHTRTLWRLLERYGIPVFLFVNKMDLPGTDSGRLLQELKNKLSTSCVDFTVPEVDRLEDMAVCDEAVLAEFLEHETVQKGEMIRMIGERRLFPVYFGSALRLRGVRELLRGLEQYTREKDYPAEFGAKVYKVTRDAGVRLTHIKITGGSLKVKTVVDQGEKADQIRIYSGPRYTLAETVVSGMVCAVTGLTGTYPGQGLGAEPDSPHPALESFLTYQVILPEGVDPGQALVKLRQLEEEDPQLHVIWNELLRQIHVQLMGEVQLEFLARLIEERFGLQVQFGTGSIVYRETIANTVEGIGHYEPLRHYAEVHLLLEPGEQGSGLQFATACSEDVLERNWQRLILTHLEEKEHRGVLAGFPITDMRITLLSGRAHVKHTEGGDFRQATYRAVRQGLMRAKSVLLEPWYEFQLEIPQQYVGRALSDLQRMSAEFATPTVQNETALLTGTAPVASMHSYPLEVAAYTRGMGRLSCVLMGYKPCHNADEVITSMQYDPERDLENTPDSVFCSHGAGFTVKWDQVEQYMHLAGWSPERPAEEAEPVRAVRSAPPQAPIADKELMEIFERTYGKITRREFQSVKKPENPRSLDKREIQPRKEQKEYLLVDGYNVIFAWKELQQLAKESLDAARTRLMDLLSNYQGFRQCVCILVFDAYKVPRAKEDVVRYHNIYVVYTKEAQTADSYIERAVYEISKEHRVRVVTSDAAEQMIVLGHGALRVAAGEFHDEAAEVQEQIREQLRQQNKKQKNPAMRQALEEAEHT